MSEKTDKTEKTERAEFNVDGDGGGTRLPRQRLALDSGVGSEREAGEYQHREESGHYRADQDPARPRVAVEPVADAQHLLVGQWWGGDDGSSARRGCGMVGR